MRRHLSRVSHLPLSHSFKKKKKKKKTYLLPLFSGVLLPVRDVVLGDVVEHVRDRTARGHRIHRDLLVPAVLREHADKRLDGAFGARVQRVLRHAEFLGRVGRHEDDTAPLVEVAVRLAGDEELRARVDAEHPVEFFLCDMHLIFLIPPLFRSGFLSEFQTEGSYLGHVAQMPKTHNPGVAAHDIQTAEMLHHVIHQPGRLRHLPDVGLDGHRAGPQALDLSHDLLGRLPRVGVVDDDFGAAAAELDRHGGADAASWAGDEGDFSVEAVGDVGGGHVVIVVCVRAWVRRGKKRCWEMENRK